MCCSQRRGGDIPIAPCFLSSHYPNIQSHSRNLPYAMPSPRATTNLHPTQQPAPSALTLRTPSTQGHHHDPHRRQHSADQTRQTKQQLLDNQKGQHAPARACIQKCPATPKSPPPMTIPCPEGLRLEAAHLATVEPEGQRPERARPGARAEHRVGRHGPRRVL